MYPDRVVCWGCRKCDRCGKTPPNHKIILLTAKILGGRVGRSRSGGLEHLLPLPLILEVLPDHPFRERGTGRGRSGNSRWVDDFGPVLENATVIAVHLNGRTVRLQNPVNLAGEGVVVGRDNGAILIVGGYDPSVEDDWFAPREPSRCALDIPVDEEPKFSNKEGILDIIPHKISSPGPLAEDTKNVGEVEVDVVRSGGRVIVVRLIEDEVALGFRVLQLNRPRYPFDHLHHRLAPPPHGPLPGPQSPPLCYPPSIAGVGRHRRRNTRR